MPLSISLWFLRLLHGGELPGFRPLFPTLGIVDKRCGEVLVALQRTSDAHRKGLSTTALGEIAEEVLRQLEVVEAPPLFAAGGRKVRGH